jgi:bacteriorhodopsin
MLLTVSLDRDETWSPRGNLAAMAVPLLTRRGFWWRVVVCTINVLCCLWMIFIMVRRHSLGAAVAVGVFGLIPLGSLVATFWLRPRRHPA